MQDEGAFFSTLIRSSKCVKWIAISKLIVSCLLSIALIVVAIFFSSSIKKSLSSENFSSSSECLQLSLQTQNNRKYI